MTVFKNFIKLAFKNKITILIYLSIFLFLTMMTSKSLSANEEFTETKIDGRVINKSNSEVSKKLEEYINSKIVKNDLINEENIEEMMFQGASSFLLVIDEDFETKFKNNEKGLKIYYDNQNPNSIYLNLQINKYLNFLEGTKNSDGSYNYDKVVEALKIKTKVSFLDKTLSHNDQFSYIRSILKLLCYPLMAVIFTSIGMVLAEFSNNALESRNKILPIKATKYNFQIFLSEVAVGLLITGMFIISIAILGVFKKGMNLNYLAIAGLLISFTLSAVSMTLLFTSISTNKYYLNIMSNVTSLFLSFLSGVMVPQDLLSSTIVNISKLFPPYYYIKGIATVFSNENPLKYILTLLAFTIFFFTLSQVISKIKSGELKYK